MTKRGAHSLGSSPLPVGTNPEINVVFAQRSSAATVALQWVAQRALMKYSCASYRDGMCAQLFRRRLAFMIHDAFMCAVYVSAFVKSRVLSESASCALSLMTLYAFVLCVHMLGFRVCSPTYMYAWVRLQLEQINVSRPTLLLLLTLTTLTTLGFVTTIQQHWDLITTLGVWDPHGPHNPNLSGHRWNPCPDELVRLPLCTV